MTRNARPYEVPPDALWLSGLGDPKFPGGRARTAVYAQTAPQRTRSLDSNTAIQEFHPYAAAEGIK
jgi:hypothetical protein